MLPRIRDHGDRFLVVLCQDAGHLGPPVGLEFHAFPDSEIKHLAVRRHLAEKSKAGHNLMIQLDQVFFGKAIDIEVTHVVSFPKLRAHFYTSPPHFATP
jgi:hypothetical protein